MAGAMVFVKLGGSLITDKRREATAREALLRRLAGEVRRAMEARPDLRLLLGHGSGSFGHWEAAKYGTQAGVRKAEEWRGFTRVGAAASRLNRLVVETFLGEGVPVLSLQPSSAAMAEDGRIVAYHIAPIERALEAGLVPLVFGDVAFDLQRGGTILSTEAIFVHLAQRLRPARILLLGNAPGVLDAERRLIPRITPQSLPRVEAWLRGSSGRDVTGGMADKVHRMVEVAAALPGLRIWIMSGREPGSLFRALTEPEHPQGTCITAEER